MRYEAIPGYRKSVKYWAIWLWYPLVTLPEWIDDMPSNPSTVRTFVVGRCEEFQQRCEIFKGRFGMASSKKRETWQTEWVHVEMTPEQKGEYRAWDMETEDIVELLGGHLSAGFKMTINYNQTNSTYQASLICNEEKGVNSGRGVSGYAARVWDAIAIVIYKVTVILPEDWTAYEPPGGSDIG